LTAPLSRDLREQSHPDRELHEEFVSVHLVGLAQDDNAQRVVGRQLADDLLQRTG